MVLVTNKSLDCKVYYASTLKLFRSQIELKLEDSNPKLLDKIQRCHHLNESA